MGGRFPEFDTKKLNVVKFTILGSITIFQLNSHSKYRVLLVKMVNCANLWNHNYVTFTLYIYQQTFSPFII